jgi:hypothetical protein
MRMQMAKMLDEPERALLRAGRLGTALSARGVLARPRQTSHARRSGRSRSELMAAIIGTARKPKVRAARPSTQLIYAIGKYESALSIEYRKLPLFPTARTVPRTRAIDALDVSPIPKR